MQFLFEKCKHMYDTKQCALHNPILYRYTNTYSKNITTKVHTKPTNVTAVYIALPIRFSDMQFARNDIQPATACIYTIGKYYAECICFSCTENMLIAFFAEGTCFVALQNTYVHSVKCLCGACIRRIFSNRSYIVIRN